MRTRGIELHPEHVSSLNLIQVDFADEENVMSKWRGYIDFLYKPIPTDQREYQRYEEQRQFLFNKLLAAIASTLSIAIESEEIKHFRYAPIGWFNDEAEQRRVRKLLIDLLQGQTALVIRQDSGELRNLEAKRIFPPPPAVYPDSNAA